VTRVNPFIVASATAFTVVFGARLTPHQRPPVVHAAAPQPSVSEAAPVLSPADEMKTFQLPPGYRVELVASEPMVQEPVAIDFDADGRLWVVEMRGYMQDLPASGEREPVGRVSVLEDVNRDGVMDKKTVFLDGLVLPRAIKVLAHGVLIGEPPHLWLARDTNGDLKADTKTEVTNKYGLATANVEHNANSLTWALDNWMHTSETTIDLRLHQGQFEIRNTVSKGQWVASQDDEGRIYRNSNESVLHVDIVPTPYYARNPNLVRTRGSYESLRGDKDENNVVWPARPTPGVNRGYQTGVLRPDGRLAKFTSASGSTVYRGDRLPAELRGSLFVLEPAANLVSRLIVSDDGTRLRARKAYDSSEFLTSTDERFRPVYLSNAPDGTLYLVDMYHGIIQHRSYITEYLRDQILSRKLDTANGHGRIYRIVHDTTKRDTRPALSKAPSARLVDLLAYPNGWWRDTAQRLLVERGDKSVVPALTKLASSATDARTRLHALWTLDGLDQITSALVTRALEDRSRDVRASAVRLAERWLRTGDNAMRLAVLKHVDDPDWWVRRQTAASLGELPRAAKDTALATVLERYGDDPVTVDAAISGLRDGEMAMIERLRRTQTETPQIATALTMLAATVVKGAQDASVQQMLGWIADEKAPAWQRSALLKGAEVTLLTATMPGGGRFGAREPTETSRAPGARSGPGGASAFPSSSSSTTPRPPRNPPLKLLSEPALAKQPSSAADDFAQRVTAVLARLEWPGKPGSMLVTPLTAEEQARFNAGKDTYNAICAACHQPDGRGREEIAPALIGSEFAVGSAGVAIRIVLHGKEGSVGLMPPLGTVFNDEQLASVLTYVRREWGHTASPVSPAMVKEVRDATADRTRPWTAEQLSSVK
jgi:mono/diheme cytochrome c family protein/glucose/arabinose dehydrogenase